MPKVVDYDAMTKHFTWARMLATLDAIVAYLAARLAERGSSR